MPFGAQTLNLMTPNADVLAADACVQAGGVCDEGCLSLMTAMWRQVHGDLAHHHRETRDWLNSPDFAEWVTVCGGDPRVVRHRLITAYWRVSA